ncbi:hypothetical protein ACFYPG_32175 [Micromonospora sp. NPDC005553]|uniref:hypothetical protein n=1 Tax=Micromonospora sp. NPDC005553 TaxID=3364232 RepID=UPI00369B5016
MDTSPNGSTLENVDSAASGSSASEQSSHFVDDQSDKQRPYLQRVNGPSSTRPSPKIAAARPRKAATKKATTARKASNKKTSAEPKKTRRTPLFPAATFEDALDLAKAIYEYGAGKPVRRLTLFDSLGKSPDSGPTRQLVTNSAKYHLTTGGYSAEHLSLTEDGLLAVADDVTPSTKARARFKLAIEQIEVFNTLFQTYNGNRLPAQAVLMDKARDLGVPDDDLTKCIETFTVNMKFTGVLRSISGAERVLSIDTVLDDFLPRTNNASLLQTIPALPNPRNEAKPGSNTEDFGKTCFYITPIGTEESEHRRHSDLFMGSLIEPALSEFGLQLVRADQIGNAGMITRQIIEYIVRSKLVIADLSFHNPNVFYELALRHAVRKPIVQISRAADPLPFDVGQVRTVVIDTTDIYSLVPQLESFKAQIATQIRKTLDEQAAVENPLSVFAPYFWQHVVA